MEGGREGGEGGREGALEEVAVEMRKIVSFLLEEGGKPFPMLLVKEGGRERGREGGLLDPRWLKACSEFVVGMGSVACPLLSKMAAVVLGEGGREGGRAGGNEGGGGKKKGGKKGAGAGKVETRTPVEPATAEGGKVRGREGGVKLKSVLQSFLVLLKDLEGALSSFATAKEGGREGGGEEEEGWLTFVREGDFADLREGVREGVRASHRLSCERLGGIVKVKREVMEGWLG
jgi:hypothetical protein